jgi:RimJ/RimL family protein N-acetyltransferase
MNGPRFTSYRAATAPRVVLGCFRREEAACMAAYRSLPEVARYQGWSTCSVEEAAELIDEMYARTPGEPGWFQFAVRDEAGALLGDAALYTTGDGRAGKIGFTLAPAAQGQGLGKETVLALVAYAFDERNMRKLTAETDARNERSSAVLLHARFALEERRDDVPFKDEYISELVYGLLRADRRE